jgi:hypothetical protein
MELALEKAIADALRPNLELLTLHDVTPSPLQ